MFLKRLCRKNRVRTDVHALRERVETFRSLVERNNRFLELVADAGEKLGGEYIFDIQYLKTLGEQLEQGVLGVVDDLNALTGNRFPQLLNRLHSIQSEVRSIVDSRIVVPETDYTIPMERLGEEHHNAVGEKMARLGEIRSRLGYRVPAGFVITTRACRTLFESAGVLPILEKLSTGEIHGEDAWTGKAEQVRRAILEAPFPRDLERAIRKALKALKKRGGCTLLAVRSSASGEDGEQTFAGQYLTLLGISYESVCDAYRQVVASLFSPGVMAYRRKAGLHTAGTMMAVGCLSMVDARAAGVIYTMDPSFPENDVLVIAAAPGLGKAVVEGTGAADRLEVSRHPPFAILRSSIAVKETMLVTDEARGVATAEVSPAASQAPCVAETEASALAEMALGIEKFLKGALDIEWAIDRDGGIHILQARPLRMGPGATAPRRQGDKWSAGHRIVMRNQGMVACRGIGAGPVMVVSDDADFGSVPQGAILVARASSPRLSAALLKAGAVITDLGTPTGHLATVAREFRVPAIVGAVDATKVMRYVHAATVDAEDNIVYEGVVQELVRRQLWTASAYQDTREFRLLRRVLRKVAPLYLDNPQSSRFTAAECRTYHDIIRFAHEKAVQCLIEGNWVDPARSGGLAREIELDVPIDLVGLDLGGGLDIAEGKSSVSLQQVRSIPLRSLLEGVLAPGAWSQDPADMDLDGFMASATRPASLTGMLPAKPEQNLAIVSQNYMHLSLKLGYHFNIIDCYITDTLNDNFIYFRFAGGVTELTRRTRRARLLKEILERYDFVVEGQGDLVIGRIKKIPAQDMKNRLRMIGGLIGFTRQLDIALRDESSVESCIEKFMTRELSWAESGSGRPGRRLQ
jgi:pyruvate,water dikinase